MCVTRSNSLVKQYLPFLLAMYFIFDSIHFISFHAGFNPIHHFYDPRIGFNPQFEKHCPHSGFPWSTSPGAWFWAPYQKSENSSTLVFFFFFLKMDSFQDKRKPCLSRFCHDYKFKINPFRYSTDFYSQLYFVSENNVYSIWQNGRKKTSWHQEVQRNKISVNISKHRMFYW